MEINPKDLPPTRVGAAPGLNGTGAAIAARALAPVEGRAKKVVAGLQFAVAQGLNFKARRLAFAPDTSERFLKLF